MAAIDWDLPDPFTLDLEVQESDIDGLGHTNNTVYLSWCGQVAWAHTVAVGLDLVDWRRLNRAMALRKSELHFLAPSFLGERLRVANWIVSCEGRLRATRRFQICRLADGLTLARVLSQYACIDLASGRPRRMPPPFRERYLVEPSVRVALAEEDSPFSLPADRS